MNITQDCELFKATKGYTRLYTAFLCISNKQSYSFLHHLRYIWPRPQDKSFDHNLARLFKAKNRFSLFFKRKSLDISRINNPTLLLINNSPLLPINNPALLYCWLKVQISSLFQPWNERLFIRIWEMEIPNNNNNNNNNKVILRTAILYFVTRSQK